MNKLREHGPLLGLGQLVSEQEFKLSFQNVDSLLYL